MRGSRDGVVEEAKERGYLVIRRYAEETRNEYYAWCKQRGIPFVVVSGQRLVSVEMDLITIDKDLTLEAIAEVDALFARYQRRPSRRTAGPTFSRVQAIPIEHSDEVAQKLIEIASSITSSHSG